MDSENRNLEKKVDAIDQKLDGLVGRLDTDPVLSDKLRYYEDALKEVVQVLEQTKSSFKSKQLRDLREKVIKVLNGEIV